MELIEDPRHGMELLRRSRIEQGFTQHELAEATGTTQSAVSEWETVGSMNLGTYLTAAAALGFRVALVPMEE
jgi:transcriptional regulator with XRE-family HTH domain